MYIVDGDLRVDQLIETPMLCEVKLGDRDSKEEQQALLADIRRRLALAGESEREGCTIDLILAFISTYLQIFLCIYRLLKISESAFK